jgi:hypothetical protein
MITEVVGVDPIALQSHSCQGVVLRYVAMVML